MANDSDDKSKLNGSAAPTDDTPRVVSLDAARARQVANHNPAPPVSEPILRLPPMTKAICGVLLVCFAAQMLLPDDIAQRLVIEGGFIPARYSGDFAFELAALWSPLTHALLHGGWLHIALNTGMLMAFGAGLEKQRGSRSILLIFLGSILCGALAQLIFYPNDMSPMIGASGGISGLFGAALMEMATRTTGPAPLWARLQHLLPFIVVWIGISVFFGFFGMPGEAQPVAWAAHIGGFAGGLLLAARPPR